MTVSESDGSNSHAELVSASLNAKWAVILTDPETSSR
jgi:hypothetical protein